MNRAIIYQSHYGATETYAKWLSEDLGADLLRAKGLKPADLKRYDTIVYGGGLYAGGVNGISLLIKNFESIKDKSLYLFTVGAADVKDPENVAAIRSALKKALPPAMWETVHLYHLRGGMRYSKMSFIHRSMMGMMLKMMRKKPESELRPEDKEMLRTYGQDTNFIDRTALAPLVADIRSETVR